MDNYEIVYAADDNFAPVLGTSLVSLFENNKDININVTIFDSGISKNNKNKIEEIFDKYHRNLPRWIVPVDLENKIGVKLDIARGSLAVYSRLFLKDFFDDDVDKVLYIDSDTIITSSIKKLWNINLGKQIIAATKDAFSKFYRGNIELKENDAMINAGVFLINLPEWKRQGVEQQFLEYICQKNGKVQLNDQGVLNHVLNNKIYFLNPSYNLLSLYYDYSYKEMEEYRKPVNFYSNSEIKNAKNNPIIIHYTSAFNTIRPWYQNSTHPLKKVWKDYYDKSPWKNVSLKVGKKKGIKRILFSIYNILPKQVSLRVASIFQVYIRPLLKSS
ncbi:glycosyltransferase family 8 protein [Ligilactobacillus aviarius]|uniref:glycosyltransferase family 8 protein n=1 Tax=Ligilactobacillus aviarius TaxID=1606 RepID=UPI0024B8CD48|nr:glycosyltransferase family 8 protein [Ligilactobacillus aviarius]